jgi:hypothetical protein
MNKDQTSKHVQGLEQLLRNSHLSLGEVVVEFREICQRLDTERDIPSGIIMHVRKLYKEIQDHLAKIKGIQQSLEGKYRPLYRRNALRDREIGELAFVAKTCFFKFQYVLKELEARERLRHVETSPQVSIRNLPLPWFRSQENQAVLSKALEGLQGLDYPLPRVLEPPVSEMEEKREVLKDGVRSLSFFVYSGEGDLVDSLQSSIRLRKRDIAERYGPGEFRGVLTHLREISYPEVERVARRFTQGGESARLKCLLLSIRSPKDFQKHMWFPPEKILETMAEGEVRPVAGG